MWNTDDGTMLTIRMNVCAIERGMRVDGVAAGGLFLVILFISCLSFVFYGFCVSASKSVDSPVRSPAFRC